METRLKDYKSEELITELKSRGFIVQSSVQSPQPIVFDESGAFGDPQQMSWEISKLRNEVKLLNERLKSPSLVNDELLQALEIIIKYAVIEKGGDISNHLSAERKIWTIAKAAIAKSSKQNEK
jgi:hypothetical protein